MLSARKLRDDALKAVDKSNWAKAEECYSQLEQIEPDEPQWALKHGEMLRRLGRQGQAVLAFGRAMDLYAKDGFLIKAIAACKLILELDPSHTEGKAKLIAFHAERGVPLGGPLAARHGGPGPARVTTTVRAATTHVDAGPARALTSRKQAATPPPVSERTRAATASARSPSSAHAALSEGFLTLSDLPLAQLVPGSRPVSTESRRRDSAYEIVLEDDEDDDQAGPAAAAATAEAERGEHGEDEFFGASVVGPSPATPPPDTISNQAIKAALPRTPLFSGLSDRHFGMMVDGVHLVRLGAGQTLFEKGDRGDALYVIASGQIAVLAPTEVARLGEGSFFGEIALLVDQPRNATARAVEQTEVLAIDRPTIAALIADSPAVLSVLLRFLRERLVATLAETSPLFSPFAPAERAQLMRRFRFLQVDRRVALVEQDKPAAGFFILLAGAADVEVDGAAVKSLSPGSVFGEMALLTGKPATATVRTRTKTFLLQLPRSAFSEIIMTHPQVLEYLNSIADERRTEIGNLRFT